MPVNDESRRVRIRNEQLIGSQFLACQCGCPSHEFVKTELPSRRGRGSIKNPPPAKVAIKVPFVVSAIK